jgi:hypothetical protein
VEAIQRRVARIPRFHMNRFQVMCALLSTVFATAGLAKLQRFSEFEDTLVASHLVPLGCVPLAATTLIVLELVLAVSLCFSRTRTTALHTAALLICVFIGYSAWRWWRHIPVPCHCFGMLFSMAPWQGLFLNGALLGLTALLLAQVDSYGGPRMAGPASTADSTEGQPTRAASVPFDDNYVTREEPLA